MSLVLPWHSEHEGAAALSGRTYSRRHLSHLQTCFLPPSFPRLATDFPSASTMSSAKSILGALLTEVPTPKPSAPASDMVPTDVSSSPPETNIFTFLNPRESSSQRTSLTISGKFPRLELGVSSRTPSRAFPRDSAAI